MSVIMGANIAGIYGAQIFRNDDRPRYRRGFAVACAVLALGLVLAIVRYVDNMIRERRKARTLTDSSSDNGIAVSPVVPSKDLPAPVFGANTRQPSI